MHFVTDRQTDSIMPIADRTVVLMSQAHPPYPLDGFCLQSRSSLTYGATAPVRYYPSSVKTTPELSGLAFGVLPKTGGEELED